MGNLAALALTSSKGGSANGFAVGGDAAGWCLWGKAVERRRGCGPTDAGAMWTGAPSPPPGERAGLPAKGSAAAGVRGLSFSWLSWPRRWISASSAAIWSLSVLLRSEMGSDFFLNNAISIGSMRSQKQDQHNSQPGQ